MSGGAVEVRFLGSTADLESAIGRATSTLKKFGGDATAAADAQVSAGVRQREELSRLAAAYHVTADASERGSQRQRQAAALAADADAKLAAQAKALADSTMTAAQRNVAAAVEQRDSLESLVAEYRAIAAAAAKGSDEQIAANNLATDSARRLAAAYGEVSAAAKASGASADESAFARGVSSKLTGVGGWMAGPGFIGGAVAGIVVDKTVKTALAAADAVRQLDQALQNAHASVAALTPILDRYDASARKLGFDDQDTRKAETELVTAFGATKKALGDLSAAEDLARLKHMNLADATQQLILLQEGNTRAAKQFGLALPDLTKAEWDAKAAQDGLTVSQEKGKTLYDELLPRIKGQSQAFANSPSGKIAEFQAELQKLEETIGTGLLPDVDKYLTRIDDWLAKSSNQKRVTEDVRTAVHDLGVVLEVAFHATEDVLKVVDPVVKGLGGWKTVLEAIIALKFADVLGGFAVGFGKMIGVAGAGGSGLLGAESASGGLLSNLTKLKLLGPITEAVAVDLIVRKISGKGTGWDLSEPAGGGGAPVGSKGNPYKPGTDLYRQWNKLHPAGLTPSGGEPFGGGQLSNPVPGSQFQRVDQGVDYQTRGVRAIKAGTIISVSGGMAGPAGQAGSSTIIKQRFDSPVKMNGRVYYGAYYSEGVALVQAGDHVAAGDPVMKGGSVEIGFLLGPSLAFPPLQGGVGAGTKPDQSGQDFADLVGKLGGPGAGSGGGSGSPYGPANPQPANSADTGASSKSAYKIPVALENKIRAAQAAFAKDATKSNLDTLVALYRQEDALAKQHGEKLPALSEIVSAEKRYQSKVVAQQVAAAKSAIAGIEKGTVGPEQALKLAQAAGASTQVILSDQGDVLAAYRAEAAQLKAKLKTTTGKAKAEVSAALAKIDQQIASVKDSIVSSLQSLAQAASQKLSSAASKVEQDVISQFEQQTQDYINGPLAAQYSQGTDPATGLARQTPAEAALAAMQTQDSQQSLQDALAQAQQQLATDQAARGITGGGGGPQWNDPYSAQVLVDGVAVGGPSDKTISDDQKAIQAAQRAITENDLATQATRERAEADAGYATAVQTYTDQRSVQEGKLQTALDNWATGLTTGTSNLSDLNAIASSFGLTLAGLSDPGTGIGYDFAVLSSAAQDAAAALAALTMAAGGTLSGATAAAIAKGLLTLGVTGSGQIHGLASGGDILSDGLVYVHAGERVQPAHVVHGGAAGGPTLVELHVDGRKLASVLAPRLDKTIRVKI